MNKLYYLALLICVLSVNNNCRNKVHTAQIDIESMDIDTIIKELRLEEKILLIHASSSFTSGGVERLGIPEIVMSDGPHGVRHEHGRDWEKEKNVRDSSTYLPVGTALASTWNPELGYKFGTVLGSEARFRGKDVILGPGLNIIRDPLNGRNFEYLTEDPFLNANMVSEYIKGVQDQGVAACAKHYIANSLEYHREYVNVEMSERALREIYLPGFKAAVDAGVLTIMSAYNKFRGVYCSHSQYLLDKLLKDELGFEGVVISDWNAVKNTVKAANAGVDIEMGSEIGMMREGQKVDYSKFHFADKLITLVEQGKVDENVIDKKVRRILRLHQKLSEFKKLPPGGYNTREHQLIAKQIADESIILLKNEDILPLSARKNQKITVIGANADHKNAGAGGSSQVKAFYEITALEGIKNLVGDYSEVVYAPAYRISREEEINQDLVTNATELAKGSDVVIYVGGWIKGYSDEWDDNAYDAEAVDKPSMNLPFGQDHIISELLKVNSKTILVFMGGGPIDMTAWINGAGAIIQAGYPGMEGGNSLAEILFGELNPSGKLSMTFPRKLKESPSHALADYPDEDLLIDHKEDIYVGYRYYDTYEVEPLFPFGHGLSYTEFEYENLNLKRADDKIEITVDIENIGNHDGKEVVQIYISDVESSADRPVKELKGFQKLFLKTGETKTAKILLTEESFKFFDQKLMDWILEPGEFEILVGSSSKDIRLSEKIIL